MEIVAREGDREVTRRVDFYNLDAIIAVGYRVNSYEATQFRIWATRTLREYLVKGFVLDDERLKRGTAAFAKDYFDELLECRCSRQRILRERPGLSLSWMGSRKKREVAMTVKKDKSTPENREFWEAVAKAAKTVEGWPAWKRGDSATQPTEKPATVQEPRTND